MNRVPDPDAVGTECQRRGKAAAIEDAPGGHDRYLVTHRVDDLGNEGKGGNLPGVAAGLGALRDDEVAAGLHGAHGVIDLSAHGDNDHVVAVAQVDHLGRHAQPGDERRRTALNDHGDLLGHTTGHRGQEVHAEGFARGRPDGGDLRHHRFVAHGRRAQAPEAARGRDGRSQRGIGHAAHPGQHDRMLDSEQLRETSTHESPSLLPADGLGSLGPPSRCAVVPPRRGP